MAYTVTVTRHSVSQISKKVFSVSIAVSVKEGEAEVFGQIVSTEFNTNEPDLDRIKASLMTNLKERWDKYAAENSIFLNPAFESLATDIKNSATAYVNL